MYEGRTKLRSIGPSLALLLYYWFQNNEVKFETITCIIQRYVNLRGEAFTQYALYLGAKLCCLWRPSSIHIQDSKLKPR